MIEIGGLTVATAAGRPLLSQLDLRVDEGERIALVGSSGAGKSTTAKALLGALSPALAVTGTVNVAGQDVTRLRGAGLARFRRSVVAYLPQNPSTTLSPRMRIDDAIRELAADPSHEDVQRRLEAVGLPGADPDFRRRRPSELSGGQRQRVALARALARRPDVLLLDEPTTGLDTHARRLVIELVDSIVDQERLTMVLITHDLPAAAQLSDRVAVLREGRIHYTGPNTCLVEPDDEYVAHLVANVPDPSQVRSPVPSQAPSPDPSQVPGPPAAPGPGGAALLDVAGLSARAPDRRRNTILHEVSFSVQRGECLAVVGSSGAGKSTLVNAIAGFRPPSAGRVSLAGQVLDGRVRRRDPAHLRALQIVPQDSVGSLNPRRSVLDIVARPAAVLRGMGRDEAERHARDVMERVGLDLAVAELRPGLLSGGQRQRVSLARALVVDPELLICDETTSDLDMDAQKKVLDLVDDLRADGCTVMLVTHDLGIVGARADRVVVLDQGRVVEQGSVQQLFHHPASVQLRTMLAEAPALQRDVRSPAGRPAGSR